MIYMTPTIWFRRYQKTINNIPKKLYLYVPKNIIYRPQQYDPDGATNAIYMIPKTLSICSQKYDLYDPYNMIDMIPKK